jgi:hypothetical protein
MKSAPEGQLRMRYDHGIQERFEKFHAENPEVYRLLVKFAREAKAAGRKKYGIASLFERLRWHVDIELKGEKEFKLNNNYRSRYARRIAAVEYDLKDFFEVRELKA